MALVLADRVKETTTTTGTGTITLAGAATGFQSFAAVGNANSTYYCIVGQGTSEWEVGIGTYTSSGTTLSRTTVLASSNTGSLVSFSAGTKDVFVTYPSSRSVYADGTTLTATNSSILPLTSGGTGVTSSSGANSVVLRDANNNITANAYFNGFTSVAASGSTITLTVASTPVYLVTGSGGQVIQLPNATTLSNGTIFSFNNNQSSGAITVNNNSGTLIVSVPSGGYTTVVLLSNSTAAGSWDRHDQTPANVSWSTNTFDYPGSITSATWNGTTIALTRGGTGQTTASAAFNALSPITSTGDLILGNGTNSATRLPIGTSTYVLTSNGTTALWAAPSGGSMVYPSGTGIAVVTSGSSWGTTLTAPSGAIVGTTDTQELTNKRVTPRVSTPAVAGTYAIDTDSFDMVVITGQSVNITDVTTTGSPRNGQKLWFSVTGTAARTILFNSANFESSTISLPTTTVSTARLDIGFVWNVATSKWRCVAQA